jgi:hypothetical protein
MIEMWANRSKHYSSHQRIFNTVFPPEESPFLSGAGKPEKLRGEQQRQWDVVTRVLKPTFSVASHDEQRVIGDGISR